MRCPHFPSKRLNRLSALARTLLITFSFPPLIFPRNKHAVKDFRLLFGGSHKTMQQSEVLILILVIRFCQLPSISLPLQKELSASVRLAKAIGHLALRSLKETYKVYFALALFPCGAHTFIFSVQSAIAAGVAPKCAAARECVHMIANYPN